MVEMSNNLTDLMEKYEPTWPESFMSGSIADRSDRQVLSDALCAWAICMAGGAPCPKFGEVMVLIGERLGMSPTPENCKALADKLLKEKKPA